jgi:hypothetical protein
MFHSDKIGAFQDIMILVHSMASTKSVETQHRLLALVATLLGVSSDQKPFRYNRHPRTTLSSFFNIESIGQVCQFVAWCHTNGNPGGKFAINYIANSRKQDADADRRNFQRTWREMERAKRLTLIRRNQLIADVLLCGSLHPLARPPSCRQDQRPVSCFRTTKDDERW